jgi:hypothetical protein
MRRSGSGMRRKWWRREDRRKYEGRGRGGFFLPFHPYRALKIWSVSFFSDDVDRHFAVPRRFVSDRSLCVGGDQKTSKIDVDFDCSPQEGATTPE